MKKNYVKPSLLSETFVANNIMSGTIDENSFISAATWGDRALYFGGKEYTGITFNAGNTLQSVSVNDFNK